MPSVNLPLGFGASFRQTCQQTLPVINVAENRFPAVTPAHDVVDVARLWDAQFTTHAASLTPASPAVDG